MKPKLLELPGRLVRWDNGPITVAQPYDLDWTDFTKAFSPRWVGPVPPGVAQEIPSSIVSPWQCLGQAIPIPVGVNPLSAILPTNQKRNFLLIQNNSSATGAGNVAPTLFVNLDGPVTTGPLVLNLAPGIGITLDTRVPTNNIYVAWGTGTGTFTQGGVIWAGNNQDQPQQIDRQSAWLNYSVPPALLAQVQAAEAQNLQYPQFV